MFGGFGGTNTTNTGGGLFGGAGGAGGGLFGYPQSQPQGQQQNQQNTGAGFGLFGGAKPGGGLFSGSALGNSQLNPTQALPSTGGSFGNAFGQSTNQPTTGGGFGSFQKPVTAPGNNAPMFGSSLNMSLPQQQPSLTASIAQPIGENVSINALLSGPRIVSVDQSPAKKNPGLFSDVPTRSPLPRVQGGYTPASSKLRGFSSSTLGGTNGSSVFPTASFTSGKPNALSLSSLPADTQSLSLMDSLLGRSSSPSLGSGSRQSVKKLVFDKKIEATDLFIKNGGSPGSLLGAGKVTFSPALSVAAREKDIIAPSAAQIEAPPAPPKPQPVSSNSGKFTASSAQLPQPDGTDGTTLEEGDYWVTPDLATLKHAGYDELSSFKGLKVGRVGYGELHFLEPVDLTGLSKLGALLGEVIRFDDKECSVYPDSEDVDKPPPGSGLNVKARLILLHCWAVDKATREPIKDETHPTASKHLKRLKNMKGTHFERFDITDGKWTFTVDHF